VNVGVCHEVTLPGPWESAIAQAGELGFAGVELFARHPLAMAELLDHPERVGRIRAAAERAGVTLVSLALSGFTDGFRLGDADAAVRAATVERVRLGIRRCAELGGGVLMLPTWPARDDQAAIDRQVASVAELVPTAAECRVRLGLETTYDSATMREILGALDSPWVGDYFDTGISVRNGRDPVAELRERAGSVIQMHVKGPQGAPLDERTVDVAGVSRALRETGFDGWMMLETRAGDDPLGKALRNQAVLRRHFAI
jgi:sugar phosphate isomerase/epimerase